MVEDFIKIHHAKSRERTRDEQERLLTKHFLKMHKDTALNRITTKDILAVTDALKELPSEQLHCYRACGSAPRIDPHRHPSATRCSSPPLLRYAPQLRP